MRSRVRQRAPEKHAFITAVRHCVLGAVTVQSVIRTVTLWYSYIVVQLHCGTVTLRYSYFAEQSRAELARQ
jgi:hypothetical protein